MLDLQRLERIRLSSNPIGQKIVGTLLLAPNYTFLPGVDIEVEDFERVPDEPVIYAMNHPDRYNYWPFQYRLWRDHDRFTSTWVKGKYYENELLGKFMELTNNIPTVSRGYLIARDFKAVCGRPPETDEYRALRDTIDVAAGLAEESEAPDNLRRAVPSAVLDAPRDTLGRFYDAESESYATYINSLFEMMMSRFVDINVDAFEEGLDLLIFPQGTRSIRLLRGRIGLAQIALYLKKTVVPVGCNGSEKVYPGNSPVAQEGHIVYRVGEPIRYEEMSDFHINEDFRPFTPEAEVAHRDKFQGFVDVVMERINDLLDEPYQFADDVERIGGESTRRFL
ncbi:MAG: lysophospholipid acyltransferase family protein [Persicimonas sp.]